MTGIGFWSYCTRPYDLWQGPNPRENDWEMVYQGDECPVPSVRWQGVRIAVEDYTRLFQIRELGRAAARMGLETEAEEAERFVEQTAMKARRSQWDPKIIARLRRQMILLKSKLSDSRRD